MIMQTADNTTTLLQITDSLDAISTIIRSVYGPLAHPFTVLSGNGSVSKTKVLKNILQNICDSSVQHAITRQTIINILENQPEQSKAGTKTAVLIASYLIHELSRLDHSNENLHDVLDGMKAGQIYIKDQLNAITIQKDHDSVVGGGLAYINFQRPLMALARNTTDSSEKTGVRILAQSLTAPISTLLCQAGFNSEEKLLRLRSVWPNQYYSLHHHGFDNSMPHSKGKMDIFLHGIDFANGKIANYLEQGITQPKQTPIDTLDLSLQITTELLKTFDIIE